jgi:hypothetical protein
MPCWRRPGPAERPTGHAAIRGWRSAGHRIILDRSAPARRPRVGSGGGVWTPRARCGSCSTPWTPTVAPTSTAWPRSTPRTPSGANANPKGPHCHNRDDIFTMFRARMDSTVRVGFDELRSTPTQVLVTARRPTSARLSVCSASRDAASSASRTTPPWRPPRQRSQAEARRLLNGGGAGGGIAGGPVRVVDREGSQRSSDAAPAASRSLSPITVAPELTGRGAVGPQVASRLNSRKKS